MPPSHTFYDEIEWLADSGITTGYPDGTFRPGAPVTRQAMAAYLERVHTGISTHESTATFNDPQTSWASDEYCPPGKRPIGGGAYPNVADIYLYASFPIGNGGWQVRFQVVPGGGSPANVTITSFVTCVPETAAG